MLRLREKRSCWVKLHKRGGGGGGGQKSLRKQIGTAVLRGALRKMWKNYRNILLVWNIGAIIGN